MTDAEILAILNRRHVQVLDELEHARRLAVLLEQERAAETASWRRNPTMIEFQRRGIGVYYGPPKRALTGDCEVDCVDGCAYPGQFSECDLGAEG